MPTRGWGKGRSRAAARRRTKRDGRITLPMWRAFYDGPRRLCDDVEATQRAHVGHFVGHFSGGYFTPLPGGRLVRVAENDYTQTVVVRDPTAEAGA
jgi:hypothetical protein